MDSIAAMTRVTMKAMPAPVNARSNRGDRALPPEAKISTAKKATTAQKAENIRGPLTEVRRLRGSPGFWCAKVIPPMRVARCGLPAVLCGVLKGCWQPTAVLQRVEPLVLVYGL